MRWMVIAILLVGCRRHHATPATLVPVEEAAPGDEPAAPLPPEPVLAPPPPPAAPVVTQPVPLPRLVSGANGDGGTVNGDPNGPRAAALNQVVSGAMPSLQRCLDEADVAEGRDLTINVKYSIQPTGRTAGVAVTGPAPAAARACVQQRVEALKFPEFGGPPVEGNFPFGYRRDVR